MFACYLIIMWPEAKLKILNLIFIFGKKDLKNNPYFIDSFTQQIFIECLLFSVLQNHDDYIHMKHLPYFQEHSK